MSKLTGSILIATIAACALTSAWAAPPPEVRVVPVRFADLNTSDPSGVSALYRRIDSAAESVCRDVRPGPDPALIKPYASCKRAALVGAIAKVNLPAVTAYARARGVLPLGPVSLASK